MIEQMAALATLRFDWADTPDHVWVDSPYHVDGLHVEVSAALDAGIRDAAASDGPSPIGLVLQGHKGVGKTHLLGLVRRHAHRAEGYFFLADVTAGDAFWENTAEALRRGLTRPDESGALQLTVFLRRLCERTGTDAATARAVTGDAVLTRSALDTFVARLRVHDPAVGRECADTLRALVLYASGDSVHNDIGEDYLGGFAESSRNERRAWGIGRQAKSALYQVSDISRLLALTGPTVMAVDQIDTLVARASLQTGQSGADTADLLVAQIADGLMRLREVTRRTLTALACLPHTWGQIRAKAADTVTDRFRESLILDRIADSEIGRALVAKRLGVAYRNMGFAPPHPTWPIAPSAFDDGWEECTPRELLKRIGAHIDGCLRTSAVRELTSFGEGAVPAAAPPPRRPRTPEPDRFAALDARFEELRSAADTKAAFDQRTEDEVMPGLLSAALRSFVIEVGNDNMEWETVDRGEAGVHAWIRRTVDETSDLQEQWAFRAIAAPHHLAVLHRLRKARTIVGLHCGAANHHLILIRNGKWSPGPKTQSELKAFEAAGGMRTKLAEDDVRTFWALREMIAGGGSEFHEWLVDRRPASRSGLLSAVLADPAAHPAALRPEALSDEFTLGTTKSGEPVRIELAGLRKHAAVFAGSGSGKTVLLRRMVEESALRGVSAVVLDPNNDLARLGDPWPKPPDAWTPDDAKAAKQYLDETDVVVWTPGRASGRPLSFWPLPDFAGVLDDEDEFAAAVEVAVAALVPQVQLTGATSKARLGQAVLREAVTHYARRGDRDLAGFIDLLTDLPEGVSTLDNGVRIAADLAEELKAAVVNDPLFTGQGEPVDPGLLLTPAPGKRARISVISFIGLPSEAQRQSFVNQLQMELFAWVKRNPAGDRPLRGLLVMDEAQTLAPSGQLTASTRSTIILASQARKYGLGLLFATQAPKGLHNQVVGNATTQIFGRLNSPAQIAAATELARAKGSPVTDIARLKRGQFYASGETFGFRAITTPLCLTHHPASPLRVEEVIDRARRNQDPP
ncbi:helicase HerA domain-containing protein [Actinokineospora sp. UTMC 2448]|uniref:helicase HerA domain-containing protein n=1 Tax=Actinokineospora sp. UTMC 2448 TaxID=2268449 RepID=UPI0021642527|nr:DUF87 domain-containing protein [Actinokineospora sp. UTMC 2448]UVS78437.1 Type IV secretory pathway, VirB4 component [Actinokineospora sp. UTMC 2448]